jgi:hypothetical protein
MSGSITRRRGHLGALRPLIIGRAVVASLVGWIPVPGLDDWLPTAIHRGTIRRIAQARGVDLDEAAVRAIADPREKPPSASRLAGVTLAMRLLGRRLRQALVAYAVARRARAAAHSFAHATLFDHYCTRLHVGLGLNAASGAEVRRLIDAAMAQTPGSIGRHAFRRAVLGVARASVRGPSRLVDLITAGALRQRLSRGDEVTAIAEVETALDRELEPRTGGPLARVVAAVELQLSAEGNPYLDQLIDTFERLWHDSRAGGTGSR